MTRDMKIVVHFNGGSNIEEMVPRSNTCSTSLKLSQYIFVVNELENLSDMLLDQPSLWDKFENVQLPESENLVFLENFPNVKFDNKFKKGWSLTYFLLLLVICLY